MVMEERKLAAFVPGYREYAANTGALLPRLAASRPAAER
jgi:protein-S-isoprenylcysteine O-methyltransferase Ste14